MNSPDYIKQFRERFENSPFFFKDDEIPRRIPRHALKELESFLTEVYEQGRKDERSSKEPLGICENCDTDNHFNCLGCKCHADY